MKKGFLIILSAVLLITSFLFTACDSWMQDDDFYSDIENDVKVANATPVSVYVRYANSKMGTTDPSGYVTMKEDVPFQLSAVTSDDYGFVRWTAFSSQNFDPSSQHSTLFYDNAEEYEKNFAGLELSSAEVVFSDPESLTTNVTLETTRSDIFITPLVAKRPAVVTSVPSNGRTDVVRNSQIRVLFSKPIDPASLKDEFGNSNIQVTSGSAVLTESASDVGSKDITDYFNITLSATKKLLTISLKKDENGNSYLMDGNSQISIIISDDVCDTDGFSMNGKHTFQFTTGTKLDSLAPYIEILTAGTGNDCTAFNQYYNPATGQPVHDGKPVYAAHAEAAGNTLSDYETVNDGLSDGKKLFAQRIKDKVNIYVKAMDIAGSGQFVSYDSDIVSESDVALLQVRASLYIDKDGNPVTTSQTAFADGSLGTSSNTVISQRDIPYAMGMKDPDCQISTAFESLYNNLTDSENTSDGPKGGHGTAFTYDLSSLDDGLIKIDIWAVDMVGNDGLSEAYATSDQVWYNNGYRSIFVVKDTTPPNAASSVNKDLMASHLAGSPTVHNYYNATSYGQIQITRDTNTIVDNGASSLVSPHNKLKWIVRPTADTSWANSISPNDSAGWKSIESDYTSLASPSNQGVVTFTYALKDDLGNISSAVPFTTINYDSAAPSVKSRLNWTAATGSTPGFASTNTLSTQTLVIPIREATAGVKSIELSVSKDGGAAYPVPFVESDLTVTSRGSSVTGWTIEGGSGNVLKFTSPQDGGFDSNITLNGIHISDATSENDLEGTYTVNATITDAAGNVTSTTASNLAELMVDPRAPVIDRIYIPSINKAVRNSDSSIEYWLDYTSPNLDTTGSYPVAKSVYVTIREGGSGAKVFDFSESTNFTLTSGSKLYRVDSTTLARTSSEIAGTASESANTFTLTDSVTTGGTSAAPQAATFEITDVKFNSGSNTDIKVKLVVSDKATKESTPKTTVESGNNTAISEFRYDTSTPVTYNSTSYPFTLRDNDFGVDTVVPQPEEGFTNSEYVKATVQIDAAYSGLYAINLSGPAEFDSTTVVKVGGTAVTTYVNPANPKTITFNTAADGSGNIVLLGSKDYKSALSLTIDNLKLTGSDGVKSVSISGTSFSRRTGDSQTTSIELDKTVPAWQGTEANGFGKGLYSKVSSSVTSTTVWPHSATGTSGSFNYGRKLGTDLYFYKQSGILIGADVFDKNITSTCWKRIVLGDEYVTEEPLYGMELERVSGDYLNETWTVYAYDKAGNKSDTITMHVIPDTKFDVDSATTHDLPKLCKYLTLSKPAGAFIYANTTPDGSYYKYVIKKDVASPYTIKVKLNGTESGDTQLDGSSTVPDGSNVAYAGKDDTTESSKIEYYSLYTSTNTDAISSYTMTTWTEYIPGQSKTISGYNTRVDSNGNIEIDIPNNVDDPLVLCLKDACDNKCAVRIRTAAMATAGKTIKWVPDDTVAVPSVSFTTSEAGSIVLPSGESGSAAVNFYKPGAKVTFTASDDCLYDQAGEGDSEHFTLAARVIKRTTAEGEPAADGSDFITTDMPTTATSDKSGWKFWKAASSSNISLELPLPYAATTSQPASNAEDYMLYYILMDRVGNYIIKPLNYTGNTATTQKWLYDNTAPKVEFTTPVAATNKMNKVGDTYYFSPNSTIKYTVTDRESGIYKDGHSSEASFSSRPRQSASTLALNATDMNNYLNTDSTDTANYKTITVSGIEDFAGNTTSKQIKFNGTSADKFVYQGDIPDLAYVNGDYKPKAETVTSFGQIRNQSAVNDSTTEGQKLSIIATSQTQLINVKLSVYATEPLLGWKITTSPLSATATSDSAFYTADDVDSTASYTTSGSYITYTFAHNKMSSWTSDWSSEFGTKYYYPVNKAGRIGPPITVVFVENKVPQLTSAGVTYNSDGSNFNTSAANPDLTKDEPSNPVITTAGSGNTAINYVKGGAKIKFTTKNKPECCYIYYGTEDPSTITDWTTNSYVYSQALSTEEDATYEVNLSSDGITGLTGRPLYLILHSAFQDSNPIPLTGPAANNLWVYDDTPPTLSYSDSYFYTVSDSGDETYRKNYSSVYYFQGNKARIYFSTVSDSVSGIKCLQWKRGTGTNDWEDVPEYDSSETDYTPLIPGYDKNTKILTMTVPEEKTSYKFRLVDKAQNITTGSSYTFQHDEWGPAPTGNFVYDLSKDDTSRKSTLNTKGLDVAYDKNGTQTANPKIRDISYSTDQSSGLDINKLTINLSNITDKVGSYDRSGIANFYIYVDDDVDNPGSVTGLVISNSLTSTQLGTTYSWNSTDKILVLNLPATLIDKVYTISAKDNVGNEEILQTFRLNADSTAPTLNDLVVKGYATDVSAATADDVTSYNGIYYIRNDKVAFTFTIDDDKATYWYATEYPGTPGTDAYEAKWTSIAASSVAYPNVTYTFTASDEAQIYYFRATDKLGNGKNSFVGAQSGSNCIKILRDKWAPTGDVGYSVNAGGDSINLEDANLVSTTAASGDTPANITIRYSNIHSNTFTSPYYIKNLVLDFENKVTDTYEGKTRSGIKEYEVYKKSGTAEGVGNLSNRADGTATSLTIDLSGNTAGTTYTYTLKVYDYAGNSKILKTFTLTSDDSVPDFAIASIKAIDSANNTNDSYHDGTYYLRGGTAVITFSKTNTDIDDIVSYEVKEGTGGYTPIAPANLTKTDDAVTYKFTAPESATTYSFRFTNKVGNVQEIKGTSAVTLVQDVTAPVVAATTPVTYTAHNGSTSTTSGYIISENDFTYNPELVNNLVFNFSGVSDACSGIKKYEYRTGTGDSATKGDITGGVVSLINASNEPITGTYTIYAIDNVGNETLLKTLVLKNNKPAPANEVEANYNSVARPHISNNCYEVADLYVTGASGQSHTLYIPNREVTFTITMNKDTVPDNELEYGVTYIGHSSSLPAPSAPAAYTSVTLDDAGKFAATIDGRQLTADNNYIFIWFKDKIGNVSNYGISYYKDRQNTWWSVDKDGPTVSNFNLNFTKNNAGVDNNKYTSSDGTIVTFNGNQIDSISLSGTFSDSGSGVSDANKVFWYRVAGATVGTKATDNKINVSGLTEGTTYEIYAKDNFGNESAVVKKIVMDKTAPSVTIADPTFYKDGSTDPVANGNGYTIDTTKDPVEITYNTGLKKFMAAVTCEESGITVKKIVNDTDKGNYDGSITLSLGNGANATITIKAFDSVANETVVASYKFIADNNQTLANVVSTGKLGIIAAGLTSLGDSDTADAPKSRLVQFINTVTDSFSTDSDFTADSSVTEKPAKKAKKAAKKAKKQAKKASGKVVSTGSTTAAGEKPAMSVEAAEILEQTLTSNVPEVAVAGESVVSEIAGVTEKVNAAEQVVSIRPTGYSTTAEASSTTAEAEATTADAGDAADAAEKKTPSKSASIVIMLAILSSFSAVWYLQRNRKK